MEVLKPFNLASMANYSDWPATIWVVVLTTIVGLLAQVARRPSMPKNAPKLFKPADWPVVGALRFFTNRGAFLKHGSQSTESGNFSFYLGKHRVVNLASLEGRKIFFESKDLSMSEGYATLYAAAPAVPDNEQDPEDRYDRWFARTITTMMKKEKFERNLPLMVKDAQTALTKTLARVGDGGLMDPFDDIYRMVYQLTMRMVGPTEFAESPKMLDETLRLFNIIEKSLSPSRVVFPWLPTFGYIKQLFYGAKLYSALNGVVNARRQEGRRVEDALQFLMDSGDGIVRILTFVMGSLFAGQLNSGINAAWLIIYLSSNPEWYKIFQQEVDGVVENHRKTPDQSAADILGTLTVDEWESEFPRIDLGLRETIRLQMVGAAFRKNISGKEVHIGNTGEVIPVGGFASFHTDLIMFNPEIYPNPAKWDPGRYLPDRAEDKSQPQAYMGWGLGRHVCLGMRFAKLEMAVILASFIAMFDFSLHHPNGQPMTEPYPTDRDTSISAHKPKRPMRLKITPRNR